MANIFSRRDLLWLVSLVLIAIVWYLDRDMLQSQLRMYEKEFYACHEKLEAAQKELDESRWQRALAPNPVKQPQLNPDPTPDSFNALKSLMDHNSGKATPISTPP
jgi:hypothetical protein